MKFSGLKSPHILSAVVLIKLGILCAVWASFDRGFTIGDKPSVAATTAGEQPAVAPAESAPAAAPPVDENSDKAPKERRSFLAELLELPPLNPDSIQKEELGRYLEIAERKKKQIEERLDLLKKREDQLKGLEKSIDEKLKLLDEERRFFAQTIQQEKDLKGERLDRLIQTYSKMEPKKAAPVFEGLDKDLVVELFKQLPQKQVTLILETMSPQKSVEISEYYGRVRSTREYDVLKEMNSSLRKEFDDCKGLPAH